MLLSAYFDLPACGVLLLHPIYVHITVITDRQTDREKRKEWEKEKDKSFLTVFSLKLWLRTASQVLLPLINQTGFLSFILLFLAAVSATFVFVARANTCLYL